MPIPHTYKTEAIVLRAYDLGEADRLLVLLLSSLASLDEAGEGLLRYFELRLLGLMGYGPEMRVCPCCRAPLASPGPFSPSLGGSLCPSCALKEPGVFPLSPAAFQALRYLPTAGMASALRVRLAPPLVRELGQVLGSYTRHTLEKKPRSATFLEQLDDLIGPLQPEGKGL